MFHKRIAIAALALTSIVTLPSCPELWEVLPKIVSVVTDAILVLDQVEAFAANHFVANPNPEKERAVAMAIGKCRNALGAAQRALKGSEDLGQEQVDNAFAHFRGAWAELSALLTGVPGIRLQRAGAPMLTAAPGELVLLEPEALDFEATP
jgi:hypothetical protein